MCRYNCEYLAKLYKRAAAYPPVFFKKNELFPQATYPFMTEEDICAKRYTIREFRMRGDSDYLSYARIAGLRKANCYEPNSPIIRSYGTIEEMVRDNWYADIDYVPEELNARV